MASQLPLAFLRPMALPRASTISRFLRTSRQFLSTNTTSTTSTTTATATTSTTSPSPSPLAAATKLLYRVNRTPSNQLPIYHLSKRGGNMKLTRIRKIDGDLAALRDELQTALGVEEKEVVINQLTRHIIVKGHKKIQVEQFFTERGM